jgi:hypothetical protein
VIALKNNQTGMVSFIPNQNNSLISLLSSFYSRFTHSSIIEMFFNLLGSFDTNLYHMLLPSYFFCEDNYLKIEDKNKEKVCEEKECYEECSINSNMISLLLKIISNNEIKKDDLTQPMIKHPSELCVDSLRKLSSLIMDMKKSEKYENSLNLKFDHVPSLSDSHSENNDSFSLLPSNSLVDLSNCFPSSRFFALSLMVLELASYFIDQQKILILSLLKLSSERKKSEGDKLKKMGLEKKEMDIKKLIEGWDDKEIRMEKERSKFEKDKEKMGGEKRILETEEQEKNKNQKRKEELELDYLEAVEFQMKEPVGSI